MSDSNGIVTESASYDSFGRTISSNLTTSYQYTGREYDEYTGLMFYRARFYDPQIGRFISEDPIGFGGNDINLYGYVKNAPLNFIDPDGMQFRSDRDRPDQYPHRNGPGGFGDLRCAFVDLAKRFGDWSPWLTGELTGGLHVGLVGVNGAVGIMINPLTLQICIYVRACVRVGPGIFLGGGAIVGGSLGSYVARSGSGGNSVGIGGDVAAPGGVSTLIGKGAAGSAGSGGAGIGVGPTIGAGVSVGVDFCHTKILYCLFTPDCPCMKE